MQRAADEQSRDAYCVDKRECDILTAKSDKRCKVECRCAVPGHKDDCLYALRLKCFQISQCAGQRADGKLCTDGEGLRAFIIALLHDGLIMNEVLPEKKA